MSQGSLTIANQSFPAFRTSLNSALQAINTTQSGTSRPSGAVAGTIWLDTTSATSPTLKFYDGADDISLATINYTANTVDWLDSSVTITGLSTSATGTVLTLTDTAHTTSVNMICGNNTALRFNELTANGSNYIGLKAPASLSADLTFTLPSVDGTAGQFIKTDGAGNLSFATAGLTGATSTATGTVLTLSDTQNIASVNVILDNEKELRFRENTTNGTNYVGLKAPANLTVDKTYTLPSADGTSGQVLQTNGSGVLSFSSPSAGSFVYLGETSASNVASVSLNGYFTSDYDVYKIFIDGLYGSSQTYTKLTFNTTGSYTEQTSNYSYILGAYVASDDTTGPAFNASYTSTSGISINNVSTTQAQGGVTEITIYNPSSTTYQKFITGNTSGYYAGALGYCSLSGVWKDATAITGVKFKMLSGNIYARKIRIYGVKNS